MERIQLTATAGNGWDERYLDNDIEEYGWFIIDGKDYCPDCANKVMNDD